MPSTKFEVGQKVMVPMRGMCTIVGIREETMLGQTLSFAELKPHGAKGVIKVPTKQLEEQGVRALVSEEELMAGLESEEDVEDFSATVPFERLDRWTDMMRNGDYGARIRVLREIALVEKRGALDAQEKKFHKQVRLAARNEIQSVLGTSAASAGRRLNEALKLKK